MERLSISELTTYRWSFDEDVLHYRAAGIPAIGVWRRKLSDFGEERGIELLAEQGMRVSNLLWAGGFTGSDGRTHRDAVKDGLDAVRLAAAMQAGSLVLYSGARNGHTLNHARRLFQDALSQLAALAGELGITLAIEPTHACCASEWSFLTTIDAALEMISKLDSSSVKLAFDTYYLGHDPNVLLHLERIAAHVAIVHLADSKRPPSAEQDRHPLGEGVLPLREIVTGLVAAGYQGYFDVELMGEQVETCDYTQLIECSKRAYADWVGAGVPQRV